MFYFVNYFMRLRTNHCTFFTISPISFIFDSARNFTRVSYHHLWCFVNIPIAWREWRNKSWEKWLTRRFTKCHLYTSRFSRFANIFSRSHQFDDKCIAGLVMYDRSDDACMHASVSNSFEPNALLPRQIFPWHPLKLPLSSLWSP